MMQSLCLILMYNLEDNKKQSIILTRISKGKENRHYKFYLRRGHLSTVNCANLQL